MKLIAEWRSAWRMLSVHVAAAWAAVFGFLVASPESLQWAWQQIPEDIRGDLPHWLRGGVAGAALLISFLAARLKRQPALQRPAAPPEQAP